MDPGPADWRRHGRRLRVINALQQLVEDEPDRFTGLSADGSEHVALYVVDPALTGEERLTVLLDDARSAGIDVRIARGVRPLRELTRIGEEILRTGFLGVARVTWSIDPPSGTVRVTVPAADVEAVRAACAQCNRCRLRSVLLVDKEVWCVEASRQRSWCCSPSRC